MLELVVPVSMAMFIGLGAYGAYSLNKALENRSEEAQEASKNWFLFTHFGAYYRPELFTEKGNRYRRRGNWSMFMSMVIFVLGVIVPTQLFGVGYPQQGNGDTIRGSQN